MMLKFWVFVDSFPFQIVCEKSLGEINYGFLKDFHPKSKAAESCETWFEGDRVNERALFIVDKEGKIAYVDIHDIGDQTDDEDLFDVLKNCSFLESLGIKDLNY